MSRSKKRSKCNKAGCLLCKPYKLTDERPHRENKKTVEDSDEPERQLLCSE